MDAVIKIRASLATGFMHFMTKSIKMFLLVSYMTFEIYQNIFSCLRKPLSLDNLRSL